jgi:hypothetical protein
VNCAAAHDRLPEHALGVLSPRDATVLERHLAWCAACRKEAGELQSAAATLAFAPVPEEPPAGLEGRVVDAIGGAAAGALAGPAPAPSKTRRSRMVGAAVLAAAIAVSGLGWGAVMAGRAARFEDQADQATLTRQSALDQLQRVLRTVEFSDPKDVAFLGTLAPYAGTQGGGAAITLVSPRLIDLAIVTVDGLRPMPPQRMPLTVWLAGDGPTLRVGTIRALDTGGGAEISRQFNRDLGDYDEVVVRDAAGEVVLRGSLGREATLASPAP